MQTFLESKDLALKKQMDELPWREAAASSIDKALLGNPLEGMASEDDASVAQQINHEISDNI